MPESLSREEITIVRSGAFCLKWAAGCWVGSVAVGLLVSTLFRRPDCGMFVVTLIGLAWIAGALLWLGGRLAMLRLQDRTSVRLSWGGLLADFSLVFALGGAFGCWSPIIAMLAFLLSFLGMQECLARLSRKIEEPSLLRRARRIEAVTLGYGLLFVLTAFTSSYLLVMLMPIVALVVIVATCTQFLLTSKALEKIGGEDSRAGLLTPIP